MPDNTIITICMVIITVVLVIAALSDKVSL
jgi:hypothetical protein